jgi:hypothetical protein
VALLSPQSYLEVPPHLFDRLIQEKQVEAEQERIATSPSFAGNRQAAAGS